MLCNRYTIFLLMLSFAVFAAAQLAEAPRNVVVFKEPGHFCGWPANIGIWRFDNEIVVGFKDGGFKPNPFGHAIDGSVPIKTRFARSLDGGESWQVEDPVYDNGANHEPPLSECPGGIDFTQPGFAMSLLMVNSEEGFSRFLWSNDRCHTWHGPYRLPEFGQKGIAARTDYIVDGPSQLTACITASKEDGREGRPLCIRSEDGGKTWNLVGWIGPEPAGYAIMPSTIRLSPTELVSVIRCKEGPRGWLDTWKSDDNGANWRLINMAAETGDASNPASLIKMSDGRLAVTYGYRETPYGIHAKLSSDGGKTWGEEIILRQDGGSWDLGYPRTVQRPDGCIVTIYYFNDHADTERYIGATIWKPTEVAPAGFVRKTTVKELSATDTRLMPQWFDDRKIANGGVYVFKPGETAHPEPRHVHDTEEVFIFLQGKGVLPIDGVEYPVQAGDVVVVRSGEDHHTRSSVEEPLVAAWYLMEK